MGREGNQTGLSNADIALLVPHLNFTRSGRYAYNNGTLEVQSSGGNYWSHTSYGKTDAYYLAFYSTLLYPRYSLIRGNGMALRCLAR